MDLRDTTDPCLSVPTPLNSKSKIPRTHLSCPLKQINRQRQSLPLPTPKVKLQAQRRTPPPPLCVFRSKGVSGSTVKWYRHHDQIYTTLVTGDDLTRDRVERSSRELEKPLT